MGLSSALSIFLYCHFGYSCQKLNRSDPKNNCAGFSVKYLPFAMYSLVLIAYLVPSPFLFFVLQQYGTGQDRFIGDDSLQKPAQLTLSPSAGDSDQQATATGTNIKVISSYFSIPTNQLAVLLTEC